MTSGNQLLEVDRWLVEVGCKWLEAGCCLMEGGCSLMEVAASNTVSVIHTAISAVRLLLTHQRTPCALAGATTAPLRRADSPRY